MKESLGTYTEHNKKQLHTIVTSAVELARDKGIDNISIAEIAKASGLTRPTVYRFFKTKEDILWAIFFDVQGQIDISLKEIISKEDDIYERVVKIAHLYVRTYGDNTSFKVFNDIFLTQYAKACEDPSYNWDMPQNVYGFRPGKTILTYFEDIPDSTDNPEVKKILVAFMYSLTPLINMINKTRNSIPIKYGFDHTEVSKLQIEWLLEGVRKSLYEIGAIDHLDYPTEDF